MNIRIDKASPLPIHDQIKDQIIGLIHAGKLRPGDQLPTMRALAIALAVNFNTVAHAYRELDSEGVIVTRRGEGTFVAAAPAEHERAGRREQKLQQLARGLLSEADRLGYSPAEVESAVLALIREQSKES